ncbi:hypothetical protein SAMN05216562_1099 [Microbulbifer marinus]|uniref:Uncharacterized protein n=1 Tax=Microbulbifer marinus TaxID=658218 RepID=A0A1H3WVB0_9GAMM|nr:hypothetical protein SAMN05216562_1099 [Microbulbifer marinus]
MSVNFNTSSEKCRATELPAAETAKKARRREWLRNRLARLLGDTARALDLEGRSQLK